MNIKRQYEFPLNDGLSDEWFRNFIRDRIVKKLNLQSFRPRFCFLKYNDSKYSLMAYNEEDADLVKTLLAQKPIIYEIKPKESNVLEQSRMEWGPD